MPQLMEPPYSQVELVSEILHGVSVADPYRWLEDQNSPNTREWINQQTRYARLYLDGVCGREQIRSRIRELLGVETYDTVRTVGNLYLFRKRLPDQEQACIYMREGADGEDHLLVDPSKRGTGNHTAVKPLVLSPDDRLLLYEVKEGGERTGTFELLDIKSGERLPDILPRGYLRGFAFAPDSNGFYYVHEAQTASRPFYRAVYQHQLGTPFSQDREIFFAGEHERIRLGVTADGTRLGFLVCKFLEKTRIDFYLQSLDSGKLPEAVVSDAEYSFGPRLVRDRIFAITDHQAPNLRIVEIRPQNHRKPEWVEIVPETAGRINGWIVAGEYLLVSRIRGTSVEVSIHDFAGKRIANLPLRDNETVRLIHGSYTNNEFLIETESFMEPVSIVRCFAPSGKRTRWARRSVPFPRGDYDSRQVSYASKDGTRIPMFLMGRRDVLAGGSHPAILTSYGGYGVSVTPQFSVFVAFLVERGCLFALPNIRGGSEFGAKWHDAAKRRNRQTAFDDFLCAAEWLVQSGRTTVDQLAIFGGSNSGLLVGAALTQRPHLFRAAVCMVPILDMLRYHLFDHAHVWRDEYGTADDPDDFRVLASYSPYHQVRQGLRYPATMLISGDADQTCNPLHARKMTARLQSASASCRPIILDYSKERGHSPVLPLSQRIDALTDRLAFLCDQLQLSGEEVRCPLCSS